MSAAVGGQILLTREVVRNARRFIREHPCIDSEPGLQLAWRDYGRWQFKGQEDDPVEIYEVGAVGIAPLKPPPRSEKASPARTQAWRWIAVAAGFLLLLMPARLAGHHPSPPAFA